MTEVTKCCPGSQGKAEDKNTNDVKIFDSVLKLAPICIWKSSVANESRDEKETTVTRNKHAPPEQRGHAW